MILFTLASSEHVSGEERTAQIKALWIRPNASKDDDNKAGAMNVEIRVRQNTMVDADGKLVPQVACSTSTPNLHNDQWQSAAWIAAFVASREFGVNIAEYEFSLRAPEPIDGPSASMAVSVTMLALMNGDTVKEDWAITGTIGPDGTIGPVGGIEKKIIAAANASSSDGKKTIRRFGFPAGQRMIYDIDQRDFVDLIILSKKVGIEAVELNGLEDAYRFVTGKNLVTKLSKIVVAPELLRPPQLSNSTISRLTASIRDFGQSYESGYADKKRLINDLLPESYKRRDFAIFMLDEAQKHHNGMKLSQHGGALAQSYFNGIRAEADLESCEIYAEMIAPATKGTKVGVMEAVKKIAASYVKIRDQVESAKRSLNDTINEGTTTGSFFTRIEGLNASISMREGFAYENSAKEMFYSALIQIMLAKNESEDSKSKVVILTDNFFDSLRLTSQYFAMALTRYRTARDWYSFSMLNRSVADVEVDRLGDDFYSMVGKYYHKGAEATLAYVNATLVDDWESEFKKGPAQGRSAYLLDFSRFPHQRAFIEPSYLPMSYATSSAIKRDVKEEADLNSWMKKEAFGLETIVARRDDDVQDYGSGVTAFLGLSSLIFKHYNYQNNVELMQNSRSFGLFLDQARDRAIRRAAQLRVELARTAGVEAKDTLLPAAIGLNIELADTLRYGSPEDMISTFQVYWRVTMLCDLGLMMLEYAEK